ncbi:MAG: HAMP domain-containing sensor histidine kinase [Pseudomonadota bacterium]
MRSLPPSPVMTILSYLHPKTRAGDTAVPAQTWRPLGLLTLYRLGVATLFLILMLSSEGLPKPLGEHNPTLFIQLTVGYLAFAVACALALLARWPAFGIQLYAQVLFDIVFITLLMHASGGISSGLGMLLVVSIAAGSILTNLRAAILLAAVATLAVLNEQLYAHLRTLSDVSGYTQAGMLGATFFGAAILSHILAQRVRESEALAQSRGEELAHMAQLTDYIVQRMQTGIIVLDGADEIRLMNESAWHLLGIAHTQERQALERLSPDLARQLKAWRSENQLYEPSAFRPFTNAADILPRFARLGRGETPGTLIFLEDTSSIAQQAQHLKLASLGRLTASIAHEIRNPLAAISHAGQLLAESVGGGEARLTQIIREQSQRMNKIVENMLQLSRRERSHPADFQLKPWLEEFVDDFTRSQNIDGAEIDLEHGAPDVVVRMDPSQLQQILCNLCENGLRYARQNGGPRLTLRNGVLLESRAPFLDVIDTGPGIAPDVVQHIFEPFFTTEQSGTGLGLYIARELCECNQARLSYVAMPAGGSCFRITFADPRRRQVA